MFLEKIKYEGLAHLSYILGDHAILYPVHWAGSVCGENMAPREFSTLGHEKRNNPVLQKIDREAFIEYKVNEAHCQPSYFRKREQYNKERAQPLDVLPRPQPMNPHDVAESETVIGLRNMKTKKQRRSHRKSCAGGVSFALFARTKNL